ncbi:MAG: twin-arginine translocase subunit TatC [Phycisphaerae bacterium]|nr:twin-arginine translocase subunit TatC [Phycisphaerae bacterium]
MPEKETETLKSMSLGDHLEELRSRLILGIAGLFVGMIVCLFFGKTLIGVMSQPFEQQIQKLRELKKVSGPDGENIPTSEQAQAVLVTYTNADGYKTYTSHIAIRDLLGTLEKASAERQEPETPAKPEANPEKAKPQASPEKPEPEVKPQEANPENAKPENANAEVKPEQANPEKPAPGKADSAKQDIAAERAQAAVIAHHPDTGFMVYATAQQLGEVLEQLKESGVLVETGAAQSSIPQATAVIVTQGPTEGFMVYMKTSMLFGILLTSPWLIWQIWAFVSAGLYQKEKRYVHTVAPISGALFITGGLFFMLVVAPLVMRFLIRFDATMGLRSFWSLQKYINMVFSLTLVFGAAFQMPIAIVFAERLGLVSIEALTKNRKFVILGLLVVSAMATPPDVVSQVSLAIPLYALYEASILYCRWRARRKKAVTSTP